MAHIYIATPMYGGMCYGVYVQSLMSAVSALSAKGHTVACAFMFNESLITRGRNHMVHGFLKTEATHLLWIDADIKFRAEDLLRMIDADVDVIGGIYPKKEINWNLVKQAVKDGKENLQNYTGAFVVNLVDNAREVTVNRDEPVEVENLGTGFLLTKRSVYEKMMETTPTYLADMNIVAGERIYAFFQDPICPVSQRFLSEDYFFCTEWRKLGGQVWAAPWCQLGHQGTYLFEGQLPEADAP
jgi:hypothetical protein